MNKPYALVRGVAANECAHWQALESNVHVDLLRCLSAHTSEQILK